MIKMIIRKVTLSGNSSYQLTSVPAGRRRGKLRAEQGWVEYGPWSDGG